MEQKLQRLLTERPIILQLLRFVAIGILNTAIDFIILNFVSKTLGINAGLKLGTINVVGFVAALIQSYYWNRYWTFNGAAADVVKDFWRLVGVGTIGMAGLGAAIGGSQINASPLFYIVVFVLFIVAEGAAWMLYGLGKDPVHVTPDTLTASESSSSAQPRKQFVSFVAVSMVGLLINSVIVAFGSHYLVNISALKANADLLKNIAKILATALSLIWNFIGYKLFVFKR